MYRRLGETVGRHPWLTLLTWTSLATVLLIWAPKPQQISKDGVFSFLPHDSKSLQADRLFRDAFPQGTDDSKEGSAAQPDPIGSDVVVVLRRDGDSGLTDADRAFVTNVLAPKLDELRRTTPTGRRPTDFPSYPELSPAEQRIRAVWTADHPRVGALLNSADGHSSLILIELKGEFLDYGNTVAIWRVEELLKNEEVRKAAPAGLELSITGSATVGRDMLVAEQESASSTDLWTKALVIILLLAIYRAPLVALIPLITVGVAVAVAVRLLTLMAQAGWVGFFAGMNVYVTVVVYGAGVDYCLFLVARFREQLEHGASYAEGVGKSVGFVGAALAASAGTSIFGILMMMSADFGKFRQAGFAISFGMLIVLLCALTLAPALLRIFGKAAFWPFIPQVQTVADHGHHYSHRWFDRIWGVVARMLEAKPGVVFVTSVMLMMPFAVIAVVQREHLSYGLLSDLPKDDPSVVGANAIQKHFPAGAAGMTTVLLKNPQFKGTVEPGQEWKFASTLSEHEKIAATLENNLRSQMGELGIIDIRTQKSPLGQAPQAKEYLDKLPLRQKPAARAVAHKAFVSSEGEHAGEVLRVDLVFDEDPFSRNSISHLAVAESAVFNALPRDLRARTDVYTLGSTAGMRDLKTVTDSDQIRIDVLVILAVYMVLILLLRQPAISAYLIVSVAFSYLCTMGVTYVTYMLLAPSFAEYAGLDWKVPIFTFTLLIALGEDYNILLMARVTEEQQKHGLVRGVLVALTRTGGIISSCGIIMAGTFCSLMTGSLHGMVQLGFALAFGVLLDTFVVRPVLVPAYLILLYRGKFGWLGPFLGKPRELPTPSPLAQATVDPEAADGDDDPLAGVVDKEPEPETASAAATYTGFAGPGVAVTEQREESPRLVAPVAAQKPVITVAAKPVTLEKPAGAKPRVLPPLPDRVVLSDNTVAKPEEKPGQSSWIQPPHIGQAGRKSVSEKAGKRRPE